MGIRVVGDAFRDEPERHATGEAVAVLRRRADEGDEYPRRLLAQILREPG